MESGGNSFWSVPNRFHFLVCDGCEDRKVVFRRMFDNIWANRLPAEARTGILAGWSDPPIPVFVSLQTDSSFAQKPGLKPAYYLHDHRRFFFHAEALFGFPDPDWLDLTIAHELAHAYLFSIPSPAHALPMLDSQAEQEKLHKDREKEVYGELERWGFKVSHHLAIYEWGMRTQLWASC
jgi:hypothetical protein